MGITKDTKKGTNMYKVALIQNQSEMSHYGYADARPLLQEFNDIRPILQESKYDIHLYTAENIDELIYEIERSEFDAVIFGSNALNDKTIRTEVQSSRFAEAFPRFLNKEKGCLILHQLRLGEFGRDGNEGPYLFNWDKISGEDNAEFIDFLKNDLGVDWVKTAKIEKIDDAMTIRVSDKKNSLELRLNNEKTKVKLIIDDNRTDEFVAKNEENGKLNIYEGSNIRFLPPKLNKVQPFARNRSEDNKNGKLISTVIKDRHTIWLYPDNVDISKIELQCLSFPSLPGLYWHYWDNVDNSEWDIHLYDVEPNDTQRPLIISSKEAEKFRIVLSALPLDWQKQKSLLKNIITYVVEGRHYTAILKDSNKTSVAFEYLIKSLRSQKFPFELYDIEKLRLLRRNIENEIHKTVVLGPFVDKDILGDELNSLIERYALDGKVRLIGIDQHDKLLKKFYVAGRERFALRLLNKIEMNIEKELREDKNGYIDGSFWSTTESLQNLSQISIILGIKYKYDVKTLEKTLINANKHDRSGSYDGVFGASCALLWLRGTYLGFNSEDSKRTLAWIREHLKAYDDREKALAYSTLIDIKAADNEDIDQLWQLLQRQHQNVKNLTEIDLIVYLKSAIQINNSDVIDSIMGRLEVLQKDGSWIDLATTAAATITFVDAWKLQKENSALSMSMSSIESIIFKSIIYIQNILESNRNKENTLYPWDNKASTSLKCIHAWLKFEELIDLPIYEMIDSLKGYSGIENQIASGKTALIVLEDIKSENRNISKKNIDLNIKNKILTEQVTKDKKIILQNKILWIYLLISLYIAISIVIYLISNNGNNNNITLTGILKGTFFDNWGSHAVFLGLILAALSAIKWKDIRNFFEGESK